MTQIQAAYVEKNAYGSIVVAGTGIHISAIGTAHEGGYTEDELLNWFGINREQLYGALAYYYGNREAILQHIDDAARQAEEMSQSNTKKLDQWRSQSDN